MLERKIIRMLLLNIFAVYEYLEYWNQQYETTL